MTANEIYWLFMVGIAITVYFMTKRRISLEAKVRYGLELTGPCLVSIGAAIMTVIIITCVIVISGMAGILRIKIPL